MQSGHAALPLSRSTRGPGRDSATLRFRVTLGVGFSAAAPRASNLAYDTILTWEAFDGWLARLRENSRSRSSRLVSRQVSLVSV